MPQVLNFRDVKTVTLDAAGRGSIVFSPTIGDWVVEQVSVTVSSNTLEPEFSAYVNGMFVGGSYSGSKTNDTTFNQPLATQETLTGIWVGGDPGAVATMVISGKKTV
jgi:hypothetical protein